MALYPSLEDMKIDQLMGAQKKFPEESILSSGTYETKSATPYALKPSAPTMPISAPSAPVYPHLGECIRLELTPNMIAANMPEYLEQPQTMEIVPKANNAGESVKNRSAVKPVNKVGKGICGKLAHPFLKTRTEKVGLKLQPINSGIFVSFIFKNSPAAMAGHGFGDQILQINGNYVAGFNIGKLHNMFEECPLNGIAAVIYNSSKHFEHTVTLHEDCSGKFGVSFKDGKIMKLVLDSSAATNGMLTDHSLLEVIGPNVIGLKDNEITGIVAEIGNVIAVTIIPSFIFQPILKRMSSSLLKGSMNHPIPGF